MYRSADDIDEFYRRTVETASTITHDFEIVFVNGGSPDHSLAKIRSYTDDPRVVIVDLSRNYGHHQAIMARLSYMRGNYIFLIDIDLEEQSELFRNTVAIMHICIMFYSIVLPNGQDSFNT